MTSATVDRQRLQAALASLNLSLEAELTQYRCHRMVQAHSPFEAPPGSRVCNFPRTECHPCCRRNSFPNRSSRCQFFGLHP